MSLVLNNFLKKSIQCMDYCVHHTLFTLLHSARKFNIVSSVVARLPVLIGHHCRLLCDWQV